jgi:hypothetical protein
MKTFAPLIFLLISTSIFGTNSLDNNHMIQLELQLDSVFKSLRNSKEDADFKKFNTEFKTKLKQVLENKEAFTYPFDSLKKMSKITSPDGEFRLFNWNVESEAGVHSFYCFILKKNGTIIELHDTHRTLNQVELKSLTHRNWYGALYYEIIPMKQGKYTLLGWNGKDEITTQKVMETMSLSRKSAKFGFALFEYPKENVTKKRIILEYSDEASVSLRYYETKMSKELVFSHLSPTTPQMKGFKQYYYPDLSFDKFILTKGKWIFESDTIMKNQKSDSDKNYNQPE